MKVVSTDGGVTWSAAKVDGKAEAGRWEIRVTGSKRRRAARRRWCAPQMARERPAGEGGLEPERVSLERVALGRVEVA